MITLLFALGYPLHVALPLGIACDIALSCMWDDLQ